MKFVLPLIVVEDVAVSRHFYEHCLGQKVRFDFGEDIQFEGDFSLHQKGHFQSLLGAANRFPVTLKANAGELFFETDELEATQERLQQAGAEFIHPIREEPWGQRVMRLYDPDGHIIEIGETLELTVVRLDKQGLSVSEINQRIGMPRDFIVQAIRNRAGR